MAQVKKKALQSALDLEKGLMRECVKKASELRQNLSVRHEAAKYLRQLAILVRAADAQARRVETLLTRHAT